MKTNFVDHTIEFVVASLQTRTGDINAEISNIKRAIATSSSSVIRAT